MHSTPSSMNWRRSAVIGLVVVLAAGAATAATLKTFVANTPALASDINDNFQAVLTPAGTVVAWAGVGTNPPSGWLFCDGTSFSGGTYPELAAALGGTTLPDLRGRVVVGVDATSLRVASAGAGSVGAAGGIDANTAVPAHTHTISTDPGHQHGMAAACGGSCGNAADGFARGNGPIDSVTFRTAGAGSHNHGGATGSTGTASVSNMQPYLTLRYLIKT